MSTPDYVAAKRGKTVKEIIAQRGVKVKSGKQEVKDAA
jgi:hypothetical protein